MGLHLFLGLHRCQGGLVSLLEIVLLPPLLKLEEEVGDRNMNNFPIAGRVRSFLQSDSIFGWAWGRGVTYK